MRISAFKAIAVITLTVGGTLVAAIGVALGGQYTEASTSRTGAAIEAAMTAKVRPNLAFVYSTRLTTGEGTISLSIPNPGAGVYALSFTTSFLPQGTPTAPQTFSCFISKEGVLLTQSTSSSTYDSGFYVGLNGTATVKLRQSSHLSLGCGAEEGSAWSWAPRPPQVTLVRLDGITRGGLTEETRREARLAR